MDIGKLLPSIRTDPEQAKSLNSSLDSISSGIQAATQTSGPAEVSDWLEKYSASFPATASPLTARSFADSAATSSPVSYLSSARQLGGENAVKSFSSLVQMDKVAIKLGDPSFKQHKHLEGFSNALANLKFDTGIAQANTKPDESSGRLRVADESSIKLRIADESSIKLRVADESSIKLRVADAAPEAMFLGDIKDSSAVATLSAENADSMIQDANVFQRLSNFQSTLKQIVSLNRGLEGK
jgi:hypothetical protein